MPSYTTSLRLVQPATGEYSGTWGTQVNTGITALVDSSIAGTTSITMTAANYTLTTANGASDESRAMFLVLGGTPGAAREVIVPAVSKLYFVTNSTTGGFAQTVKTASGSGISVPNGARMTLRCDGTDVVAAQNYFASMTLGAALPVASGGTGSTSTTYCSLTTNVTGTLPVANGGTGITSFGTGVATWLGTPSSANLAAAVTDETGSGALVFGTSPTLTTPVVTALNTGQLAGMRNKLINSDMTIAQRGTSFPAVGAGTYTLDRWRTSTNATSAVLTASQQSDVPSSNEFQNSLRLAVTTADTSIASTDQFNIQQRIEGYNARDLIGKTFALSFWVRSTKTGTHCVYFQNSGQDRTFVVEYTVSASNTWEYKTVTVSGGLITAGTWDWTTGIGLVVGWTLAAGSSVQTTANAWQTGTFLATSNQVNCLDSTSNIFAITGVQLEVGSVATPFEHRLFGAELALCRRYTRVQAYQAPATTAQNLGTIDMRAVPTITGGGAGFTSTNTTADQLIAFQTTAGVQTLTLAAEL